MIVLNKSILNLPLRFIRLYIYAVYGNLGATLPFWEGGHQWLHFTHENAEITAKVKFVRVESNMGTWNAIKKSSTACIQFFHRFQQGIALES